MSDNPQTTKPSVATCKKCGHPIRLTEPCCPCQITQEEQRVANIRMIYETMMAEQMCNMKNPPHWGAPL